MNFQRAPSRHFSLAKNVKTTLALTVSKWEVKKCFRFTDG